MDTRRRVPLMGRVKTEVGGKGRMRWAALGVVLAFLVTACAETPIAPTGPPPAPPSPSPPPAGPRNPRVADFEVEAFSHLLPLDAIAPIYEPEFASSDSAPLSPDELVIGVALDGQARAYPISVLRFREMVNDELADLPILVTW